MSIFNCTHKKPAFAISQPCILCGDSGQNNSCMCNACQQELPFIENACVSCGLPLTPAETEAHCGACLSLPPPVEHCISLLHYHPPVDYLIKQMKYHNQLAIASLMGELMAKKITQQQTHIGSRPEQIIPVPLHINRLQQRGYNQAIEVGRRISKELGIPLNLNHCQRTKSTAPQFDLPASERAHNIKNAFEISPLLNARHVAIVDDVMTTGGTVWEITNTLIKAGVRRVDVWVCARATVD